MKNKIYISIFISLVFLITGLWGFANENDVKHDNVKIGKLVVETMDLRSNNGKVRAYLFDKPDGYPMSFEKSIMTRVADIMDNKALLDFADLPYGSYAICAYHDEDNDGKLKTNFIGIPKEGIAASNDAKGTIGPPKYKDAMIELNSPELKISVHMGYF